MNLPLSQSLARVVKSTEHPPGCPVDSTAVSQDSQEP